MSNTVYKKARKGCFSSFGLKRCKGKTNRRVFQRAVKKRANNLIKYWERRNEQSY